MTLNIFVPILWVCINGHCEFIQQNTYFTSEAECAQAVRKQKKKIREMVEKTDGVLGDFEGTCVDAKIKRLINSVSF